MDAGSGSGAGSVVLKTTFPAARVTAIDNRETHQKGQENAHPAYFVREPPRWAAQFYPESIEDFSRRHPQESDLILAAHLPVIYDRSHARQKSCLRGARKVLGLTQMLSPNGILVFGYNREQKPHALTTLVENFRLSQLFEEIHPVNGRFDEWTVLQNPDATFLQEAANEPTLLLTEKGRQEYKPYEQCAAIIIGWD